VEWPLLGLGLQRVEWPLLGRKGPLLAFERRYLKAYRCLLKA
jgi:hypothetical protein